MRFTVPKKTALWLAIAVGGSTAFSTCQTRVKDALVQATSNYALGLPAQITCDLFAFDGSCQDLEGGAPATGFP